MNTIQNDLKQKKNINVQYVCIYFHWISNAALENLTHIAGVRALETD